MSTKATRWAPDYAIERAIVTGCLETRSRLRIGSGFAARPESGDGEAGEGALLTLCREAGGAPYIPASSLRGFLRRRAEERAEIDAATREQIFGSARGESKDKASKPPGGPGALRVYDARLDDPEGANEAVSAETRIAVDSVTGTVLDRFLFTEEVVPVGSRFRFRLELDRISEADLEAVIELLSSIDGGPSSGIGAGRSRLGGRLAVAGSIQIRILSRGDYRRWLHRDRPLAEYFREDYCDPTPAEEPTRSGAEGDAVRLVMHIRPHSPLLVSAAQEEVIDGQRVRVCQTEDGQVLVPAASLKGMLRAQARRILLTMLADRAEASAGADGEPLGFDALRTIADAMIEQVFGGTDAIAALWVGDAIGGNAEQDAHPQHFNAIDRFTGGVADQRLYRVQAVIPDMLRFTLLLRPALLQAGWKLGLLCYLLRDALEGDLCLGWGRARGYGQIHIVQAEVDPGGEKPMPTWPQARRALLDQIPELPGISGGISEWLDALEHKIHAEQLRRTEQTAEEQTE
jgi:CRISPR/Cas system CSM-associated protein Csm3 (group 7 of RAMP superfamily)